MIVLFDVVTRTFTIESSSESYGDTLTAIINRHGMIVPMRGVQFGFSAYHNGEEVESKIWPAPGVSYSKTDQNTLASYILTWKPDEEVSINAWLVDSLGQRHEASTTFTAPRPPQLYPSWIWNEEAWQPPIPYPEDGNMYEWDEDNMMWVELQ